MGRRSDNIPTGFKTELKQAVSDWVSSLSRQEAKTAAITVSGKDYTPLQILEEVQQETGFGIEFLTSLYSLHDRMNKRQPGTSVLSLIRRSIRRAYPQPQ